ncbi:MAG: ASKHA domain-containing protein, partial [Halobacteriota archaeon]
INPSGYVYWLPVSGGWGGPEKVAVLLASGHYAEAPMTVCIDIGTNGEISVGNAEQTWTTSAPAGPALEGAELTHGVRAQAGAIDHVSVDPDDLEPHVETIDDAAPIGLCGSGVIDALAQLFLVGIVDRRGTFALDDDEHPRLRTNDDGVREFVLVEADASGTDRPVVITQNDIRDVQMAKAAIQAGTLVLMETLEVESVDRLVIAGAFGNYIDPASAMLIGLYPDLPLESVTSLGNGAGVGAQLALLDSEARAEAARIVDQVDYFEIAGTDVFQEHFLQSMYLPHQVFERYPRVKARVDAVRSPIDVEQPLGDG